MTLELPIVAAEEQLPVPASRRFMPLRSAVQNLWHHDIVLEYCDGKMLNRGHNGSGKSIFLGLQWPFLLSGRVRDAVPPGNRGQMEDVRNMMLAFGHYTSRLGYTWIEFGRLTDAGPEYRTLGAGLSASAGSVVVHWHFITERRVGRDVDLFDAARTPLDRAALAAVLGRDHIFGGDDLSAYRAAVDRDLFGLGPERYQQLVSVLRALSKPTLGALNAEQTGEHVRDFLPKLPAELFEAIANHFSHTDGLHDRVQQLDGAVAAMDAVLEAHRNYSRDVLRRLSADLRKADSDYEEARTQSRRLTAQKEAADAAVFRARADAEAAGRALTAAQVRVHTLDNSTEVTAARDAKAAGELEQFVAHQHQQASADRQRAHQDEEAAQGRVDEASSEAATAVEDTRAAGENAQQRAPQAVFDDLHAMLSGLIAAGDAGRAQRRLDDELSRRRTAVHQLHALSATVTHRGQDLKAAERRLDDAQRQLDEALDARSTAGEVVARTEASLLTTIEIWHANCGELKLSSDDIALVEGAVAVRESLHQVASRVAAPRRVMLTAGQTARGTDAERAEKLLADLSDEYSRVASAREDGPPPQPSRMRPIERPGAPFWKVVDFKSHVGPEVAAAVEASLQAAGLLDAWLTPDGTLLANDDLDAAVIPGEPVQGASLADVLVPDAEGVAREVVHRLLASVALDQPKRIVSVGSDGRYALGPLQGRWRKEEPEHIGAAARQRARERRLAELNEKIAQAEHQRDAARSAETVFRDRLVALEEDLNRLPDDTRLHRADAGLAAAEHTVAAREEAVTSVRSAAEAARSALAEAREALVRRGLETGLSAWIDDLGRLEDNTHAYRDAAAAWFQASAVLRQRQRRLLELQEELSGKQKEVARREEREVELGDELARAASHHQALRERAGSDAEKALADLADAKDQEVRARAENGAAGERRIAAEREQAEVAVKVEGVGATVNQAAATRDAAADAMRDAIRLGVLTTARWETLVEDTNPDELGVRRLRDIARLPQIMPAPGREPEPRAGHTLEAWNSNAARLTDYDVHLDGSMAGIFALHIPRGSYKSDSLDISGGLLRDVRVRVAADVEETRALISREEMEFFNGVILDEAARRLNEALTSSTDHLARINALLERHPTRAGHIVRVSWKLRPQPLAPEGTREIVELVAQRADLLPEDRRAVLRRWLQQRVDAARQDQDGPFVDRLDRAFNYTTWYRAEVQVRMPNQGDWTPFDSGRIPLSAGERATLLYLPLFAAVATAYSGARLDAPRLFALDEAFERIDDGMRESIFAMIGALDLDLLMANFSLKPFYDTIRGIAVNIMTRRQDGPGVGVTSSYWNGGTLVEDV